MVAFIGADPLVAKVFHAVRRGLSGSGAYVYVREAVVPTDAQLLAQDITK
jgi:hypothetical protein